MKVVASVHKLYFNYHFLFYHLPQKNKKCKIRQDILPTKDFICLFLTFYYYSR